MFHACTINNALLQIQAYERVVTGLELGGAAGSNLALTVTINNTWLWIIYYYCYSCLLSIQTPLLDNIY